MSLELVFLSCKVNDPLFNCPFVSRLTLQFYMYHFDLALFEILSRAKPYGLFKVLLKSR